MDEVLLRHVSVVLVLTHNFGKQEPAVHGQGNNTAKEKCPQEEASVENVTC